MSTIPENFPKIISVDDHVIEHRTVWLDRLPKKYHDVGPRTIQERGNMQFVGGVFSYSPTRTVSCATGGSTRTSRCPRPACPRRSGSTATT